MNLSVFGKNQFKNHEDMPPNTLQCESGDMFEFIGLKQVNGIALNIVIEGRNAIGFPFLFCVHNRVNLFTNLPSQLHKRITHLIVVFLMQLVLGSMISMSQSELFRA